MPWITVITAAALGCAAVAFIWLGVSGYITEGNRLTRRLQPGARGGAGQGAAEQRLIADDSALRSVEKFLTPKDEKEISKVQERLFRAGYRNPAAVLIYFAVKWGVALSGLMLGALAFAAIMNPAQPLLPILSVVLIVALSFFATDMWVGRRSAYRKIDIEKAFPDALDLLLVCIEAGHGLDQAIGRVTVEIQKSAPVLADELQLVVAQLRAGKERDRVLSDFADRVGVDDISAFVTVIKQADKFGVSIGDTLRVYASEMRNKRFMRAETKANMMPIQLALGAIAFTVPPTILVLIGPSIILIVREMAKAAAGG